jgi:hypothetical protein
MRLAVKNILKTRVKAPLHSVFRGARHLLGKKLSQLPLKTNYIPNQRPKVLIVGVYVSSVKHLAEQLCAEFSASRHCSVVQRWASLGYKSKSASLASLTVLESLERVPKFELLNRLVSDIDTSQFDYILCTDDDVSVQPGFLDSYIALQQQFDFSICQPARTWTSSFDHKFVRRHRTLLARQTRFVEIGPIFSFDRKIAASLIPFDLATPMGWGYDFVWPVQAAELNLSMGIIDAVTVDHTIRPRSAIYSSGIAAEQSIAYRQKHGGLTDAQAFVVLRRFK